jgi:hypothetical protein
VTQVFRTLVLYYPVLDARFGSGLNRRRARRVMGREERAVIDAVVDTMPATVAAWSEGAAALEPFDIVSVRRPLGSLSSSGAGRWWVGPREVGPELRDVAATGAAYDSVIVLWPGDPDVPQCGWGCTLGPSNATFGAGFSSISTDHWPTLATDPDPIQGYVHEWLHQVETVYRGLGLSETELPPLHDAAAFTSTRPRDEPPFGRSYADYHDGVDSRAGARTWAPWYRDYLTGRLRRVGATGATGPTRATGAAGGGAPQALFEVPIGLTAERWQRRSAADSP